MMRGAVAAAACLATLAACAMNAMPQPPEGARIFAANCTACHGDRGQGGELIGGHRAPDLTALSAASGGVFPRARVLSHIDGYGRGKAPAEVMPEFGRLLEGETVPVKVDGVMTPTPRPLAALMAYLESIQAQ